jgi:hypothetical protein
MNQCKRLSDCPADRLAQCRGDCAPAGDGVDFGVDGRSVRVSQEAYSIFLAREQMGKDRVAAMQQRLNIADQRVCDLQSELAESRKVQLSGCEFTEHELLARAVRAARGTSRGAVQRWVATKNAFGCGSGVANALCRRFGFDPDEMVKP